MYKIKHYLFGWNYIAWRNSCDSGVSRVHKDRNNKVYYFRYSITGFMDIIKTKDQVIWLTCKPEECLTL